MASLLAPEEAAEQLQVTRRWVVEAAARGELPGIKLGRHWRIDPQDLADWIDKQRATAREGAGPRMIAHAFVFAFQRPDGQWGVINDKHRRLVITLRPAVAATSRRSSPSAPGLAITPVLRDPAEIALLVMSAHVAATNIMRHVVIIEQGTEDVADAEFKAGELVNAVPLDSEGDWWASTARRRHAHDGPAGGRHPGHGAAPARHGGHHRVGWLGLVGWLHRPVLDRGGHDRAGRGRTRSHWMELVRALVASASDRRLARTASRLMLPPMPGVGQPSRLAKHRPATRRGAGAA